MKIILQVVDNKTVAENDYNISVSSYVENQKIREVVDIAELNKEIKNCQDRQGAS